jgi:hypothetical protein
VATLYKGESYILLYLKPPIGLPASFPQRFDRSVGCDAQLRSKVYDQTQLCLSPSHSLDFRIGILRAMSLEERKRHGAVIVPYRHLAGHADRVAFGKFSWYANYPAQSGMIGQAA